MVQKEIKRLRNLLIGALVCLVLVTVFVVASLFKEPEQKERTTEQKDFEHYSKELAERAERGDIKAQYDLGNCYFYGFGINKDYKEAVKWLRKAAEQGYAPAQNDLGHCYHVGAGVQRNHSEAVRWWNKAAGNE